MKCDFNEVVVDSNDCDDIIDDDDIFIYVIL